MLIVLQTNHFRPNFYGLSIRLLTARTLKPYKLKISNTTSQKTHYSFMYACLSVYACQYICACVYVCVCVCVCMCACLFVYACVPVCVRIQKLNSGTSYNLYLLFDAVIILKCLNCNRILAIKGVKFIKYFEKKCREEGTVIWQVQIWLHFLKIL
jgi:hypothetical protein